MKSLLKTYKKHIKIGKNMMLSGEFSGFCGVGQGISFGLDGSWVEGDLGIWETVFLEVEAELLARVELALDG